MNASIYVWSRDALLRSETVIQDNTGLFEMPSERSVDVDSEIDFQLVELLLSRRLKTREGEGK
jgi:CMP-N-acetylneuraminic acid synthetase